MFGPTSDWVSARPNGLQAAGAFPQLRCDPIRASVESNGIFPQRLSRRDGGMVRKFTPRLGPITMGKESKHSSLLRQTEAKEGDAKRGCGPNWGKGRKVREMTWFFKRLVYSGQCLPAYFQ